MADIRTTLCHSATYRTSSCHNSPFASHYSNLYNNVNDPQRESEIQLMAPESLKIPVVIDRTLDIHIINQLAYDID